MEDSVYVDVCLVTENVNRKYLRTFKDYLPFALLIPLICFTIFTYVFSISQSYIPTIIETIWYENEIIYEINVPKFYDSDNDGIGDLQGVLNKLDYFDKNHIQTILFQSSIFNISEQVIELWNREYGKLQTSDLLTLDSHIGNEADWNQLREAFHRKNMHLIIDLPLSSTVNLTYSPCSKNKKDFGCIYTKAYKRMPLDFSDEAVANEAEFRIRYWFEKKNVDGIRVDLPLEIDPNSQTYILSIKTIDRWRNLIEQTKLLLLFDIPNDLQKKIADEDIHYANCISLFFETRALSPFWQMKPNRDSVRLGMLDALSQRIFLTIGMLIGGTPIVVYGDELGVKQKYDSWMPWISEDGMETSVEIQESIVENENESLLLFFRNLTMLRKNEVFQKGITKYNIDSTRNLIWFVRDSPPDDQRFIIIIHMNRFQDEAIHISVQDLVSDQSLPEQITKVYQWPKQYLSNSESNRLLIYPGTINIFSW